MVNITFILSGETTERIPNLFTELVIITLLTKLTANYSFWSKKAGRTEGW